MSNAAAHEPTGLAHAYLLDGRGGGEQLDWNGVERWTPSDGALWLNLDYSAPDAASWLALRSKIAPVIRDALVDEDPRPRLKAPPVIRARCPTRNLMILGLGMIESVLVLVVVFLLTKM